MTTSCIYPDNELNFSSSLINSEHCIADIQLWMTRNILRMIIKQRLYIWHYHIVLSIKTPVLQIGTPSIVRKGSVKNLGIFLTDV